MKRLGISLVMFAAAACGSDAPIPAPTPVVPACQTNNTATVSFGNRSAATTQDVIWDGNKITTVTPGQTSASITAAAGVAHALQFRITNTTLAACAPSSPIPTQCGAPVYTCAFP